MRTIRPHRPSALLVPVLLAVAVGFTGSTEFVATGAAPCRLDSEGAATGVDGDLLSAVAGDGARGFWSVGIHFDGGKGRALMLRSSADGWHRVPVRLPRSEVGNAELDDIAFVSPSEAWAVGENGPGRVVIVRWDGVAWRHVGLPAELGADRGLYGVSALSANDVWAVGRSSGGSDVTTLVMRWDGSAWSVVPSPSPSRYLSVLEDVAAVGPSDVWAVGYSVRGGRYRTLVEHWDGTTWSVVKSPDVAGADATLMGVVAVGPGDVWAVGWSGTASDQTQGLTLHWDGTSWSRVDVPSHDSARTRLFAVAAVPGGPVAVGQMADEDSSLRPLALRWTGQAWTQVTVESVDADDASLVGLASGPRVVAVGTALFQPGFGSLVESGC
jgi:hypothetical protein